MGRLVVRAGGGWLRWVQELADWCQVPVSTVVDQALRRYAEAGAWNRPAPARVEHRRGLTTEERKRVEAQEFFREGVWAPDATADCPPLPEPEGPEP